jgi:hydrogenase maturation protein HypF
MIAECRRVLVRGVVQGVGFRPFVYRLAQEHHLSGFVRNLGDAGVEILVQGSGRAIESFLKALESDAPPLSRLDSIAVSPSVATHAEGFTILPSTQEGASGGQLPPDVATCDDCVTEILGESRFTGYWATSCTNCGPRFTVIESLPYDRPRTSMSDFPMCGSCASEYADPMDRRYHAQTTACAHCGPTLQFDGDAKDAVPRAVQALREGKILAIKGIGGTHIACDATNERVLDRLRTRLGRSTQPFAVMGYEHMLLRFVDATDDELVELRKPHRPIVVLGKQCEDSLPGVAPGLHTLGAMLPYSGVHHLLLAAVDGPLVMTSANLPGRPMLIRNDEIATQLAGVVDHYLLHDRRIVARCDDSVCRAGGFGFVLLRRSRGLVPQGVTCELGQAPILALGPESDVTFAVYDRQRITLSQHIGHVDDLETLDALRGAIDHMYRITGADRAAIIACDAHPNFLTTQWADELASRTGARVVRVQHHAAHLLSVMMEHRIEQAVGILLDGYGFGVDGAAWGGEILVARDGTLVRAGSLRPVPLPGGDLAARQPLRMAASLLHAAGEDAEAIREALMMRGLDRVEAGLLLRQIEGRVNAPPTTSAGRFLDAVAAWLGVCRTRTYEGEPAMRLEAAAVRGRARELAGEYCEDGRFVYLGAPRLFADLTRLSERASVDDVAATAQEALARGMATLAIRAAEQNGIRSIALSGGVAYNRHIASRIREICEAEGLDFFMNRDVPCGDGGVSLGQAVYAGLGYRWGEPEDVISH